MPFEKLERQRLRHKGVGPLARLAFNKVTFNSSAARKFNLEQYLYADIYIDRDRQLLGIELHETDTTGNCHAIVRTGGAFCISISRALRELEITENQNWTPVVFDPETQLLVLDYTGASIRPQGIEGVDDEADDVEDASATEEDIPEPDDDDFELTAED